MKKQIALLLLSAFTALAQVQFIDLTTPHTNVYSTAAQINVPGRGWMNEPYQTTNYVVVSYGDAPATVNAKINSDLNYLTNRLAYVTVTNPVSLAAGATPYVTNVGTTMAVVLQFGIPAGAPGTNFVTSVSYSNAVVDSPIITEFTTNNITLTTGAGDRYVLSTLITNFADMSYITVGSFHPEYSFDGGSTWSNAVPVSMTNSFTLSFVTDIVSSMGAPVTPAVSNLVVRAITRPDLLNVVHQLYYQDLRVLAPATSDSVVPKNYVDTAFAAVNFMLNGGIYMQSTPVNLDGQWSLSANGVSTVICYLGVPVLTCMVPPLGFGTETISRTNTTIYLKVPTNSVTAQPIAQWSASLVHPAWQIVPNTTNSWPSFTGTNYTISFPMMTNVPVAFIRIGYNSGATSVSSLGGIMALNPFTVGAATNSTFGVGAGLIACDTNWLYVSIASNTWRRISIPTNTW